MPYVKIEQCYFAVQVCDYAETSIICLMSI